MIPISIHLAVEDDLSEIVLRRLLRERPLPYAIDKVFMKGGFGYLKRNSAAFNNMAKASPVILLTDLDRRPCAPEMIADWLNQPKQPDFLFRVAVREVEAWLLACDEALRKFLATRTVRSFPNPEELNDPKMELLNLAERSTKRDIRDAIARRDTNGVLRQGPAYTSTLSGFVDQHWMPQHAASRCRSLERMLLALDRWETTWKSRHPHTQ